MLRPITVSDETQRRHVNPEEIDFFCWGERGQLVVGLSNGDVFRLFNVTPQYLLDALAQREVTVLTYKETETDLRHSSDGVIYVVNYVEEQELSGQNALCFRSGKRALVASSA